MKVKSFLLGLLAMTAVVACQEDQLQETPKLDLGSESVTVPAEGQDVTFTVTSNVAWTATSDKEWATVDPASGDGSDSAVTVTVEVGANDEEAARTAVITVAAGDLTKTFTINQPAMEAVAGDTWYVAGGFNEWSTTASPMTLENGWYVLTDVAVKADGFKFLKNSSWDVNLTADATVVPNVKYAALDGQGKGNTFVDPLGTYDLYLAETLDSLCVMTPGLKPGEEPSTGGDVTLNGKQWVFTWSLMETQAVFDFGVTTPGVCWLGVYYNEMWVQYIPMGYQIVPTDATSGVIKINAAGDEMELPYSELTENTVSIAATDFLYEDVTCALAESFLVLVENGGGGGEEPSGIIENGLYWIVEGTWFAEPKPADATYGYLPSSEGVENGGSLASLASNAFTFTYVADYGSYTIQDSYGRYLGQGYNSETEEVYKSFNFANSLPVDEEIGLYLWTIDAPYYGESNEGEWDIYNLSTDYSICYDPNFGTWAIYDASDEAAFPGYPTLIKADNPVESLPEPEPELPAGPVEATIAEFIAAAESDSVWYRLTGIIENLYNTTYGNFYLTDGANTVQVYGLTASQVSDNDKSFASLGLKEGDQVTLVGTRTTYKDAAQVGGPAYYISHVSACYTPVVTSPENKITITCETEDATIYYAIGDGEYQIYSAPIEYSSDCKVKAYAEKDGMITSAVTTKECVYVAEGEVVPYEYTFTEKQFSANGDVALGDLTWTLDGDGGYWGYDSNKVKGQQFGSGSKPYKTLTLSTTGYKDPVDRITINTSGANSIAATLVVTVNDVPYGDVITLTKEATTYTVNAPESGAESGEIKFSYTQTSSKAIYINSIAINPATK